MDNFRYERKWIYNTDFLSLLMTCSKSKFIFLKDFPKRTVNSIYFDDHNKNAVQSNLSGLRNRKKVRFRWYGNKNIIDKIFLEQKIKYNSVGKKIINEIKVNLNTKSKSFLLELKKICNLNSLYNLYPTAYVKYERHYLISKKNPSIRCTIDNNVKYFQILNKEYIEMKKINQNELILEIKYPINLHDEVKMCMNFPISRLQKNSKYVRCFFG